MAPSNLTDHAGVSVWVSMTLTYPWGVPSPANMNLPSSVTYRLWTGPSVRTLLTLVRDAVSIISATPGLSPPLPDSHVDFFPIRRNRDVVGTARERDLLDDLQRLDIRHVQRPVGLIADEDPGCVGGRRDAMGRLDARDFSHDLVRDRVNQVVRPPAALLWRIRTWA